MADKDLYGVEFEMVGWRSPKSGRFIAVSDQARSAVRDAANSSGKQMQKIAEDLSPVGKLRPTAPRGGKRVEADSIKKSWTFRFTPNTDGGTATLANKAKHFGFYIKGTPKHEIRARRAKYLVFPNKSGSGWVFRKSVMHPGTKPHDLLERIEDKVKQEATAEVRRVANHIATEIRKVMD